MKKTVLLLLAFSLLLFPLTSCGTPAEAPTATGENESAPVRVMALQGPTGMGLSMVWNERESDCRDYKIQFLSSAEISNVAAAMVTGECDIAAVPVNMASVLYQKTGGKVSILCANTLGVLHLLENGNSVHSVKDLKGKKIVATGLGSTPEYILRAILKKNGLDPEKDVELQFVSDHTELANFLAAEAYAVGVLPEPNVTAVLTKNPALRKALDLTEEWKKVSGDDLVQGVFIVRDAFYAEHPETVQRFLEKYEESQKFTNENPEKAAKIIVEAGIGANPEMIAKAIPGCHIVCLTGEEMKKSISSTLSALFEFNPESVGGKLPDEAIYELK